MEIGYSVKTRAVLRTYCSGRTSLYTGSSQQYRLSDHANSCRNSIIHVHVHVWYSSHYQAANLYIGWRQHITNYCSKPVHVCICIIPMSAESRPTSYLPLGMRPIPCTKKEIYVCRNGRLTLYFNSDARQTDPGPGWTSLQLIFTLLPAFPPRS